MECICNGKNLIALSSQDSKNQFSLYPVENVEVKDISDDNECLHIEKVVRYINLAFVSLDSTSSWRCY